MQPVRSGPWPVGMNNRLPEHALPSVNGAISALRNAVNVDLDAAGNARRRAGYTKVVSGLGTRSGFSCEAGSFYVEGANLMRLNDDDTTTLLFGGLPGSPVAFEYFDGVVYISDGIGTYKLIGNDVTPWEIDSSVRDDPEYMGPVKAQILRYWHGRMYFVSGDVVWFSDPYKVGSVQKQRNFIQFPAQVTMFEPVSGGIWVACGDTRFLAGGDPSEFVQQQQLNYGAVFGTSVQVPYTNDIMWYSERGVCVGTQDGQTKNIQEQNVAAESGTDGAAVIREENGIRQYIASVRNQTVSPLAATSFMEMEVVRKEGDQP